MTSCEPFDDEDYYNEDAEHNLDIGKFKLGDFEYKKGVMLRFFIFEQ